MPNNNLAYDLSRYEQKEERKKAPSRIKARASAASAAADAFKAFQMIVVISVMAFLMISAKADIAQIHSDITAAKSDVQSLQNENSSMLASLETKSSMKTVEDYAENVLGMQKLEKSQIEYVSLENGNIAEIPETSGDIFTKIKQTFEDFVEYLRG
ncbi:MAG: hypothetical protein LIO69_08495 [Oscillospiraceae bacterium]|nr:hypothetical protein [Oscillospiraceae bacterium]